MASSDPFDQMTEWTKRQMKSTAETIGGEEEAGQGSRLYTFRVRAHVQPGETVAVTGNCKSLGSWKHDRVFFLTNERAESGDLWSGSVRLPLEARIEYRYVVMIVVEPDGHRVTQHHHVVRRWETHTEPRVIKSVLNGSTTNDDFPFQNDIDVLGSHNGKEMIARGWLTTETAIQLKLFNSNLQIWKNKLKKHKIFVKVTPINLSRSSLTQEPPPLEDGLSLETMDITDSNEGWPVVEVAVLDQDGSDFRLQEQFGREFIEGEFMVFQVLLPSPVAMAMMMDFYAQSRSVDDDDDGSTKEAPLHIGFCYFLPNAMKNSEGQIVVPITSVRHRPIGEVTVEYLKVKPTSHYTCDLSFSLHRQWNDNWRGLDVGHRGAGTSFREDLKKSANSSESESEPGSDEMGSSLSSERRRRDQQSETSSTPRSRIKPMCAELRENTIASLKSAAGHGADFVEFDVQLSRDLVPVLYHDFYVAIAMMRKKHLSAKETIQLPVKDLSLEQLQRLKLFHVHEKVNESKFADEHSEDHQPFPTLQQALDIVDISVGFNIEIKWTMQLRDGTYELYHPFDLNLYLDTVLEVVLRHGRNRKIVFSCFHPDICSMIRLKQNRYPVMFLTQGVTDRYPPYHDPRCLNVPIAIQFAVNMDILGINVHTEDLLRDSSQIELVKNAGLILFCWGEDNNDSETIRHLKNLGIHAVIYDRIDKLGNKEVKESIFSLEAKGIERLMIKAAAERADKDDYLHPTPQSSEIPQPSEVTEGREGASGGDPIAQFVWPSQTREAEQAPPN